MSILDVREATGKLRDLLDWLVRTWQDKDWVGLLLIVEVLLLGLIQILPKFIPAVSRLPAPIYAGLSGAIIVSVFVTAFVVDLRKKAVNAREESSDRHIAIRGLRAFDRQDAKFFGKLQRGRMLSECGAALTGSEFRLCVLYGESGTGKTSFLQAALVPYLEERGYVCVYVKFSDGDPESMVEDATADALELPEEAGGPDLARLLADAGRHAGKPVVFVFDQFEQFFMHARRREERASFVGALARWYKEPKGSSVKLLVSIRADFANRLVELQKVMQYSLGPQQSFLLEKFDPSEAAEVLRVIAETEEMEFDSKFVERLTQHELAKDGLVSPVDLQVLAWMIAGEKNPAHRAFRDDSYVRIGGLAGLMERFLTRALTARETPARRHAAVKVLLALTDLEGSARSGVKTLSELQRTTRADLSTAEVKEAVKWLSRSDVRLLTEVKRHGGVGYELAHEHMIPALKRIMGKELTPVERAHQLLDRRVREWMMNNEDSHYLLRWPELRVIERQRSYLDWSSQREHKERLLVRSRRRVHRRMLGGVVAVLLLAAVGGSWSSPSGQRYRIFQRYTKLAEAGFQNPQWTAHTYGLAGRVNTALKISDYLPKDEAIRSRLEIAELQAESGNRDAALSILHSTERRIMDLRYTAQRSQALAWLALTFNNVGAKADARRVILRAEALALDIANPDTRGLVLTEVGATISVVGDRAHGARLLDQSWSLAKTDSAMTRVLNASSESALITKDSAFLIAFALRFASLRDTRYQRDVWVQAARSCVAVCSSTQLRHIIRLRSRVHGWPMDQDTPAAGVLVDAGRKLRDIDLLRLAERSYDLGNRGFMSVDFTRLVKAFDEVGGPGTGRKFLESLLQAIPDTEAAAERARLMAAILDAAAAAGELQYARVLLDEMLRLSPSQDINRSVVSAHLALARVTREREHVRRARILADDMGYHSQTRFLQLLAVVEFEHGNFGSWEETLKTASRIAWIKADRTLADEIYGDLAAGYGFLGYWRDAREAAERIGSDNLREVALGGLLRLRFAQQHPEVTLPWAPRYNLFSSERMADLVWAKLQPS